MPITAIGRGDIAAVLDVVEARAPVMANRVLQYAKPMFRRLVERGLIEASPAAALRRRAREVPRDRVLTAPELAAVWRACEAGGTWFGPMVRLLILTGMRRGEPPVARHEGADDLVVERTKQGTAHTIALPAEARAPARRFYGDPSRPCEPRRACWGKRWARLLRLAGLPPLAFRVHDLRRTWATEAARIGVDPLIIELCLGHAPGGVLGRVGAIYNRHSYADRCAKAWARTAKHLVRIVADN